MIIYSPQQLAILASSKRKNMGLTQANVADKVGLQQKTISAFENNPERVMLSTALLILSALDLDLELENKKALNKQDKLWTQEW